MALKIHIPLTLSVALIGTAAFGQTNLGWANLYDSAAKNRDYSQATAVDAKGNIYVGGTTFSSATGSDLLVLKYDSSGKLLWSKSISHSNALPDFNTGRYNGLEQVYALGVDSVGNVWITGEVWLADGSRVCPIYRLSPKGSILKKVIVDNPTGFQYNAGTNLTVLPDDSVVVVGNSYKGQVESALVTKFSAGGSTVWQKRVQWQAGQYCGARAVAAATDGSLFINGFAQDNNNRWDIWTGRLSADGALAWTRKLDTGSAEDAIGLRVVGSRVIGLGRTNGKGAGMDHLVYQYDLNGNLRWQRIWDATNQALDDEPLALEVDKDGYAYVTGRTTVIVSPTFSHPVLNVAKFTPSGTLAASALYGDGGYSDHPGVFPTPSRGMTLATTTWENGNGWGQVSLLAFDANLKLTGEQHYRHSSKGYSACHAAALGPDGAILTTGDASNTGSISERDVVTMRWNPAARTPMRYSTAKGTLLTVPAPGLQADADFSGVITSKGSLTTHGVLTTYSTGVFKYAPDAGFTGLDSFTYRHRSGTWETGLRTVNLKVVKVTPDITGSIARVGDDLIATVTVTNPSTVPISGVTLESVTLNKVATKTTVPKKLGDLAPGASATATFKFGVIAPGSYPLRIGGSFTGDTLFKGLTVTIP